MTHPFRFAVQLAEATSAGVTMDRPGRPPRFESGSTPSFKASPNGTHFRLGHRPDPEPRAVRQAVDNARAPTRCFSEAGHYPHPAAVIPHIQRGFSVAAPMILWMI